MAYKPRVGITMRTEIETRRFYLGRDYSEALIAAGSLPVHIPLVPDESYVNDVVAELDGVMLPGADCDVDPGIYGEDPHPKLKRVVPEKDQTDRLVLEAAESRGIPIIAICYGMQALNVFRGGDLFQDIESQVPNAIKHEQGIPITRRSHWITIDEQSRLGDLASESHGPKVKVNSHHHQAIRNLGKDLTATAWTSDGIIEAIEDPRHGRYAIGYQWHPEMDFNGDALSESIFESFVQACREFADNKSSIIKV